MIETAPTGEERITYDNQCSRLLLCECHKGCFDGEHPTQVFADQTAWTAHLEWLGILALKVHPDPVMVASPSP
jgi:hypothetical protein